MARVISKISLGSIRPGDTIAKFDNAIFAPAHYWVQRGWAYVEIK